MDADDGHESVASPGEDLSSEPMIGTAGGETTDSPEVAAEPTTAIGRARSTPTTPATATAPPASPCAARHGR